MKKSAVILLILMLLISALTGCGNNKAPADDPTDEKTDTVGYTYLYRDLPEAKYITPAAAFAGGDGSEKDPYQISDAAELALFHEKMSADRSFAKAYYVLTADIVVNDVSDFDHWATTAPEYSWLPSTEDFQGVFDGRGHTVSGLYINANNGTEEKNSTDNYGLFDSVFGTVKNIKIDKSYFEISGNPCNVGSIAGSLCGDGVIENCTSSAVFKNYDATCGGIVGKTSGGIDYGDEETDAKYSTVSACTFLGAIEQVKDGAMSYIGGIAGNSDGNIDSCENKGQISFTASNVDSVGGIVGKVGEGAVRGCSNTADLLCTTFEADKLAIAGGIVGKVFVSATGSEKYMSRGASVSKCTNTGTVTGQMYAGGIAGQVSNDHNRYCITVSDCVNEGVVSAEKYIGGIIGYMNCEGKNTDSESIVVENCENKAELSKGTVGGIIANFMSTSGDVTIRNCKNSGTLSSEGQHCAGIIAYWIMDSNPSASHIVVDGCKNTGNIFSSSSAAGIISFMDMPVCHKKSDDISITIANCVNDGTVSASTINGYIGGILGNWGMADIDTEIDRCTNNGTLAFTKETDGVGDDDAAIMTFSRIAGGIVGRVGSGLLLTTDSDEPNEKNIQSDKAVLKISNSSNTGKPKTVNPNAENISNCFGGIIGNTCGEDGYAFFVDNCTYTGFERGLGNKDLPDIGTKN